MGGLLLIFSLIAVNIIVYWLISADRSAEGKHYGFLALKQSSKKDDDLKKARKSPFIKTKNK
jgi:hypothetical protein